MSVVSEVLAFLAPAAAAVKASLKGEVAAGVPKLTDEGLEVLENVVGPKLDVPAEVIALAKGENATIEAAANPFLESELDLLIARIPS